MVTTAPRRLLTTFLALALATLPAAASAQAYDDEYQEPTKEQLDQSAKRALKQKDAVEARSWLAAKTDRGMFGIERKTLVRGVGASAPAGNHPLCSSA